MACRVFLFSGEKHTAFTTEDPVWMSQFMYSDPYDLFTGDTEWIKQSMSGNSIERKNGNINFARLKYHV
jgi:hypothetical protein